MLTSSKISLAAVLGLLALLFGTVSAQESNSQTTNPTGVEGLLKTADDLAAREDCFVAQVIYQRALERDPDNVRAKLGQANMLACQGAYDKAIDIDQAVLKQDPRNVTALLQLADAYKDQYFEDPSLHPNRLMDALDTINSAQESDPGSARVLNLKGTILYYLEDYQGAREALESAIELAKAPEAGYSDLDRSQMNINLGKTLTRLGELELAKTVFQRAVKLNPSSADAHNNLGSVYYQLGNCDQAPYELSQAAALDPGLAAAVANLGIALFECGQVEASVEPLEKAIDLNAGLTAPPLYTYLARAYMQQGRLDEAVAEAQKGALLQPQSADGYYWLGKIYQEIGNPQQARNSFQRALELDPEYSPAQDALEALPR